MVLVAEVDLQIRAAAPAVATTHLIALDAHHARVGAMAHQLAERLDMVSDRCRSIGAAAARHDIGKLFLSLEIFDAPQPLTAREQAQMRLHTILGHAALDSFGDPALRVAARVAIEHHEHWDGGGYPFGIRGEAISIEARIVAVCDVYDALRDVRSYKRGFTHEEAMAVLTQGDDRTRPTMFDPDVVHVVLRDDGRFLDRAARGAQRSCLPA